MRYQKTFFLVISFFLLGFPVLAQEIDVSAVVPSVLPVCGDGNCDSEETCSNCPQDCGICEEVEGVVISLPPQAFLETKITFKGKAYLNADVFLLKNGEIVSSAKAKNNAKFEISLSNISPKIYNFGIWTKDNENRRSITRTFNVKIIPNRTIIINDIFIPPSIATDKIEVEKNDLLKIFGQSVPVAKISIFVKSEKSKIEIVKKTSVNEKGAWFYNFNTEGIDYGDYFVQAQAKHKKDISPLSQAIFFKISDIDKYRSEFAIFKGDLNSDGKVNIVDFSIIVYWYKRQLSPKILEIERKNLNNDGKIDLIDFSIIAYYWTG